MAERTSRVVGLLSCHVSRSSVLVAGSAAAVVGWSWCCGSNGNWSTRQDLTLSNSGPIWAGKGSLTRAVISAANSRSLQRAVARPLEQLQRVYVAYGVAGFSFPPACGEEKTAAVVDRACSAGRLSTLAGWLGSASVGRE